jgi:hypothetical protein
MKKLLMNSLMLLAVLTALGQTKVAPTLQKGMTKTYETTTVMQASGQNAVTFKEEDTYTVSAANSDGYTIDIVSNNITSDAAADNIMGQVTTAANQLYAGLKVSVATDKSGKPMKIANYAELKPQLDAGADKLLAVLLEKIPALQDAMGKEQLKSVIMKMASEENLLNQVKTSTSVLTLNGKTITTAMSESYVNEKKLKMKRMYFVSGQTITSNASLDMTKDELKALIIAEVEKDAPQQADMMKQNIDLLMDSGQLKMDITENATFQLDTDGWIKGIKVESDINTIGQKVTTTTTVNQK